MAALATAAAADKGDAQPWRVAPLPTVTAHPTLPRVVPQHSPTWREIANMRPAAYCLPYADTDSICLGHAQAAIDPTHTMSTTGGSTPCLRDWPGARLLGKATALSYVMRRCGCNAHNALVNRHLAPRPEVTIRPQQCTASRPVTRSTAVAFAKNAVALGRTATGEQVDGMCCATWRRTHQPYGILPHEYSPHCMACNQTWHPYTAFIELLTRHRARLAAAFQHWLVHYDAHWGDKWTARRRTEFADAAQAEPYADNRVVLMLKYEGAHEEPSKARGLMKNAALSSQERHARVTCALQKAFCEVLCDDTPHMPVTFASGLNANQLAAWGDTSDAQSPAPRYYERDGKNWDSTMHWHHHNLKVHCYALALSEHPQLRDEYLRYVDDCYECLGRHTNKDGTLIKYTSYGCTKSGHNDTTLGNSLINAAIALQACTDVGYRARIIVAGDDCLAAVYTPHHPDTITHRMSRAEACYGIRPEARSFYELEHASFISAVWAHDGTCYRFVPKPGRLMARLFWTCKPPSRQKVGSFKNAVVTGLWPTCRGVPVLRAFLDAHRTHSDPTGEAARAAYAHLNDMLRYHVATADQGDATGMVPWMCRRYGLSPTEVRRIERLLGSLPPGAKVLAHPLLARVCEVDLADLMDRP